MKKPSALFLQRGSKGIPKKNILPIAGLPLLVHSINLAKNLRKLIRFSYLLIVMK